MHYVCNLADCTHILYVQSRVQMPLFIICFTRNAHTLLEKLPVVVMCQGKEMKKNTQEGVIYGRES